MGLDAGRALTGQGGLKSVEAFASEVHVLVAMREAIGGLNGGEVVPHGLLHGELSK